jgi:hypothetical protein
MRPIGETGATVRETAVNGAGGVSRRRGLLEREILAHALVDALRKFSQRAQVRNPVIFAAVTGGTGHRRPRFVFLGSASIMFLQLNRSLAGPR